MQMDVGRSQCCVRRSSAARLAAQLFLSPFCLFDFRFLWTGAERSACRTAAEQEGEQEGEKPAPTI
jgi:hypothetical protein